MNVTQEKIEQGMEKEQMQETTKWINLTKWNDETEITKEDMELINEFLDV